MQSGPPAETLDPGNLDEIGIIECWQLLCTQPIGRVAVILGDYAVVFPVTYTVRDRSILYWTNAGTKLDAIRRSNVTFEVDEIDRIHRSGWSVMAKGVAQEISTEGGSQEPSGANPTITTSWAPGTREHLIRLQPHQVTGRRIRPAEVKPATDQRGYL
jgi:nitroimidazol reductase NimA-like FMN-containing flavoprotein (pyridoxamine 5'-phosphate oxidase superfamily)